LDYLDFFTCFYIHPTIGVTIVVDTIKDNHIRDRHRMSSEIIRVIEIECPEKTVKCMEKILFFLDLTFIDFLVTPLAESTCLVEYIPGLKESVVSQYIGIVSVKL
jgi:hypothetical protein